MRLYTPCRINISVGGKDWCVLEKEIKLNDNVKVLVGILIPFAGTALGASMVFFLKNGMKSGVQKALLGFASGVMIAASVWSLLIPAIEMAEADGGPGWLPAVVGFLLGISFLLALDNLIPHLHLNSDVPEGKAAKLRKSSMLILAVTLHNIPEGMAVGVLFAGMLEGSRTISSEGAFALAFGIALQNIPEGAIISMPLLGNGFSKRKSFFYGLLSGVVEPVGSIFTILLTAFLMPFLPYMLSFAAGAMIYVVVEELIPESQAGEHSNIGTIGVAVGFVLMMFLDTAL